MAWPQGPGLDIGGHTGLEKPDLRICTGCDGSEEKDPMSCLEPRPLLDAHTCVTIDSLLSPDDHRHLNLLFVV